MNSKITLALSATVLSVPLLVGWSSSSVVVPSAVIIAPSQQTIAQTQPTQTQSATLKNLQAAYNGESNANVMYLAYAQKADQEGYKEVASLFRATAQAEAIHRDNHAKVIRELGATPTNKIATPVVKSTQENLQQAIKGESYEKDTMYPDFIEQAKKDGNQDAVQTFEWALEAEAGHAQLYTEAANNLPNWTAQTTFYVCSVSGDTTMKLDENDCVINGVKQSIQNIN